MEKVLQFSGGKDSLACLWLLRAEWDELLVLCVNPGDMDAERERELTAVAKMVPHFRMVMGDQPKFVREVGWPVDFLPERMSKFGHVVQDAGRGKVMLARSHDCCMANLWGPLAEATKAAGAKIIYRGTRTEDRRKTGIPNGAVIEGVEYRFPVLNWTTAEVLAYLGDKVPGYIARGEEASGDCVHCTAYLDENVGRIRALPHASRQVVMWVLAEQRRAMLDGLGELEEVLHGYD